MRISLKTGLLAILLNILPGAQAQNGSVITHYATRGNQATLRLNWTDDNYGTVRWQTSTDNGATWSDLNGVTGTEYSYIPTSDALYRITVNGDEACQPIVETHLVKAVTLTCRISKRDSHSVTCKVSNLSIPKEDIVEYGFLRNYTGLSRTADNMYREPVGTTLSEDGTFEMACTGLLPNRTYSMYVYFKTKDGSILKRSLGNSVQTTAGIEWDSEGWGITKNSVTARFKMSGSSEISNVTYEFGTPGQMNTYAATANSDQQYTAQTVRSLQPGTEYLARVTATVGDNIQVIEKTIRTMSDYTAYPVDNTVAPIAHHVTWRASRKQFNPDNIQAEYPRLLRVSSDTILVTYHGGDGTGDNIDHWQNIYLQRSVDNGQTWSEPEKLMDHTMTYTTHGWFRFADPELTRLDNGWIVLHYIANANPETNENCEVQACISRDGGITWGDPVTIGRGRTWEPKIVQLPGGELEMLVSSEAQWWRTANQGPQEILCARSTDNGQTWTSYVRASYNPGKRDGMPVPVVLQGNKGITFIIESVNDANASPSLVHRDLDTEWDSTEWDGTEDAQRWTTSLKGGGAPYMIQLPTGELLLTTHANASTGVWQTSRPTVMIADNTGHNISQATSLLSNLPTGEGAYYCSLFQKDEKTIWLAISHSVYDGDTCKKNSVEYIVGTIR